MFKRTRYQFGYLRRKRRKRGPDVWVWEYSSKGPDGRRKRDSVIVGSVAQFRTEADAWRVAEGFRLQANAFKPAQEVTFGALVDRYVREKLPKRYATASKYRSVKEFRQLLEQLKEPFRTMCIVAACLGLRASEVVGLQWGRLRLERPSGPHSTRSGDRSDR
jgi:integrase